LGLWGWSIEVVDYLGSAFLAETPIIFKLAPNHGSTARFLHGYGVLLLKFKLAAKINTTKAF
jgi:hypothetical protein